MSGLHVDPTLRKITIDDLVAKYNAFRLFLYSLRFVLVVAE
jgi:hypothetical protein